jgi:hypothetical protein
MRTLNASGHVAAAVSAPSAPVIPDRIRLFAEELNDVMVEHGNRIWPSYDWSDDQVVLVDEAQRRAWVWNDQSLGANQRGGVSEIDFESLPPGFLTTYSFGQWKGEDTMSISLTDSGPYTPGRMDPALRLAIHEGFHH